jgi:hypothetical protein
VHGACACWRHVLIRTPSPLCGCLSHAFESTLCRQAVSGEHGGLAARSCSTSRSADSTSTAAHGRRRASDAACRGATKPRRSARTRRATWRTLESARRHLRRAAFGAQTRAAISAAPANAMPTAPMSAIAHGAAAEEAACREASRSRQVASAAPWLNEQRRPGVSTLCSAPQHRAVSSAGGAVAMPHAPPCSKRGPTGPAGVAQCMPRDASVADCAAADEMEWLFMLDSQCNVRTLGSADRRAWDLDGLLSGRP